MLRGTLRKGAFGQHCAFNGQLRQIKKGLSIVDQPTCRRESLSGRADVVGWHALYSSTNTCRTVMNVDAFLLHRDACAGARQLQQLLGKTAEPLYLVNDTRCALCLLRADELCR